MKPASLLVVVLLAMVLTACSLAHPQRKLKNHHRVSSQNKNSVSSQGKTAALRSYMRFQAIRGDELGGSTSSASGEESEEEDLVAEEWATRMLTRGNGLGKKALRDSMKATVKEMCKHAKASAILENIKAQPSTKFVRGQKVNAVLNVVVFYNLKYNGEAVATMAETKNAFTESKIANAFSGYMVHPDQQGEGREALTGAFDRAVDTLELLSEKAPGVITEIFADEPLSSASCYPARVNKLSKALETVMQAQEMAQGGATGIFDAHADNSAFVLQWVSEKLAEMFPDKDDETLTGADVRAMFADNGVAEETGVRADSPRVASIISNLEVSMLISEGER